MPSQSSRRVALGSKVKCPKCNLSNLNAHHTATGGIDVLCKKCKTVMFGISPQKKPEPSMVDEIVTKLNVGGIDGNPKES